MAKATATKLARIFEEIPAHQRKHKKSGVVSFVPAELMKRGEVMPAQPREERPCRYCHKPMSVAAGQIAFYHSECRKTKRSLRKQGKRGIR